ncbi:type VI secretion system protein [Salmonella bongori]|uniref:type VI secretion system protein n=1 Tax=Salmonella bongori TaxID=54736 RepID=UPI0020A681FF|nr:type VI secretion system protein [Salmonella bongori]
MTQPWLTLLIIVLVLLVVTLWCLWWQWEYRNNTFIRAQKEIQHACGGQDPYDSNRILMLGDEADNRLLCRSWSLADGAEYWFGQWWYNQQCSLLCVPQTLQMPGKKRLIRQSDWQKLLAALVKSRPQRPLDAIIITLPLDALRGDDNKQAQLLNNCHQIQQACGLSLPVYLIVSGLEEIEGTQDLLTLLSDEAKRSPIGSAIPVAREAIWKSVWIDDALANTRHTLRDVITALGTLHGHTSGTLFRLPEFFPTIAPPCMIILIPCSIAAPGTNRRCYAASGLSPAALSPINHTCSFARIYWREKSLPKAGWRSRFAVCCDLICGAILLRLPAIVARVFSGWWR